MEESMGLKAQIKVYKTRLAEIENKIEFLERERERRRNILIIDGIPEKEGE